tara:strand:- start:101 stop:382 length:282 start_codon:yes stop_codon:yes gene_type:complete
MFFFIILLALVLANLPWFSNHIFIFFPLSKTKSILYILLEIVVYYIFLGIFVTFIEKQIIGNTHSQDWEFYVVTFFLFIVFSSPGFIFKIVWK